MSKHITNITIALVGLTVHAAAKPNTRPNIIIMQADDMGCDDMSHRGNTCVETPHLDQMTQQSVSFDQFYVHSVSAPTRASLLTGRHFLRTGVYGVHGGRDFLNLDEVTMAETFRQNGYKTGMWGKWHSGKTDGYYPWDRGFDEAYMANLYQYKNNKGLLNGKEQTLVGWTDSLITDMAINFISKNKSKPFLAYIPFLSPHGIWDAPPQYVKKYKDKGQSENFATLNAMIDHLDSQVGRIFATVRKLGLEDNTIIIFMSDNGPIQQVGNLKLTDQEWELRNPTQMKGNKATNWQNGVRSPLFIYWKGHYSPCSNQNLLTIYDIYPTLCDIANVEIPKKSKMLDGISFKKTLENKKIKLPQRDVFFAQYYPLISDTEEKGREQFIPLSTENIQKIKIDNQVLGLRSGDYKMLYNQRKEIPVSLRNITNDYREQYELFNDNKELANDYLIRTQTWFNAILMDSKSFQMPVFQIGWKGKSDSEILCYAPNRISETMLNDSHFLRNLSKKGDFAEYNINVLTEGVYNIKINSKEVQKAVIKISTDHNLKGDVIYLSAKNSSVIQLPLNKQDKMLRLEVMETIGAFDLSTLSLSRGGIPPNENQSYELTNKIKQSKK